jgi:hypothetical protein
MKRFIRFITACCFLVVVVHPVTAQDTLPSFSAVIRSGKVIISWANPYDSVVQISIQRSVDSLRGFRTIITLPDPTPSVNGYLDSKAPDTLQFYRLYIQLQRGKFFQTKSLRPRADTARTVKVELAAKQRSGFQFIKDEPLPAGIEPKTKDSVKTTPKPQKYVWVPSAYVYTNKEGNIVLALPEAEKKQFRVQFYQPDGKPFFEVSRVTERMILLDKTNFHRAGWYDFELFENEKLKEKNKVQVLKVRQ